MNTVQLLRIAITAFATTLLIFAGAIAEELPPCGDYTEPEFWFEVPNFFELPRLQLGDDS